MIIIPAVDIKEGRCVRLLQGRPEEETVYSNDPETMAMRWEQEGAKRLHVVDLDGAFVGRPLNRDTVKRLLKAVKVPVQVGGGIRDIRTIEEYLEDGVDRVILGTAALEEMNFLKEACSLFPGKIAVGLDTKDGRLAVRGWRELVDLTPLQIARSIERYGICCLIYTDILRDGTQKGINVQATAELARSISIPVIASGGVASIEDIRNISKFAHYGIEGVIIGKALYSGRIILSEAIKVAQEECRKGKGPADKEFQFLGP
ncbi:MAG: 1-(5-phosphoribosyl)-5-[(5-phosphoribosylamino)methylideneamino]imidazole-4-carboxamide isomerase [Candidatus Bathyarchaeia archaeon]